MVKKRMEERKKMKTAMQNAKVERQTLEIFGYISVSSTHFLMYGDYETALHTS
jgi:hypothetical protein